MFGIKKKGRANALKFHAFLRDILSPLFLKIGRMLRIEGRSRMANRWARRNPRAFMTGYCIVAALIFSVTVLLDFLPGDKPKEETDLVSSIVPINNRLKYLDSYETNQQLLKAEIAEMGRKGQKLYNEMDSLMKIEDLTRNDSARIADIYNNLNTTFNNRRNEPKEH